MNQVAVFAAVLLALAMLTAVHRQAAKAATSAQTITVDGTSPGRTFSGVGGLSAGGSSRLLINYPEPERSQILDYLFKPDYGASLQILKVEIGGDTDATTGPEQSIERKRGQVNCNAGYEWWLMAQAKARNPQIKFYGLEWGTPGWFRSDPGEPDDFYHRYWSQDNVNYLLTWLGCARQHGFQISYLGGANESYHGAPGETAGYNKKFYEELHQAVHAHGYHTKVLASDQHAPPHYWTVATDMKNDPAFNAAVDVLGEHDVCVWRSLYKHCHSSQDARSLGKPLFNSEQTTQDFEVGAKPLARAMNRHYIDAQVTGNINYSLLAAWYDDFPIGGTGPMLANRPWSGYYDVGPDIWVDAQTTQFARPGWRYLHNSSGYLANGASYVTLRSPDSSNYSTVLETMDATAPETVHFNITGGLSPGTVHVWTTDLDSSSSGNWFVHSADIQPAGSSYSVTLQPGRIYTLTTTTGQHKGGAQPGGGPGSPGAGPAAQLPLPFRQDFENVAPGRLAPYFSDNDGAYQAEPCQGGRHGTCYEQVITQAPMPWHNTAEPPATIVGDPRWWGDYQVSADAMLEGPGSLELLGRVESQQHDVAGYHLRLSNTANTWTLYTEDTAGKDTTLASGPAQVGTGSWHHLVLRFHGTTITALLDGRQLTTVQDGHHTTGQAGFQTSQWQRAQFDNLTVVPTGPAPSFVSHSGMTATASSAHNANDFGHAYPASYAIDDQVWSSWRSEYSPPARLPQSITLDLHSIRSVSALSYKPQVTGPGTGTIEGYQVELSSNGRNWQEVAAGTWPATIATKVASWAHPRQARYVRLVAISSTGCPATASAAEINVSPTPITDFAALSGPPSTGGAGLPPQFQKTVPQSQMTATATSQNTGYPARYAIDGNCGTFWHTEYSPQHVPLPQSITLNLGGTYPVDGLSYLPRQDGQGNGNITTYNVYVSPDGTNFTKVASGTWPDDNSLKDVTWAATSAHYVRLEAVTGHGDFASAAELNLADGP